MWTGEIWQLICLKILNKINENYCANTADIYEVLAVPGTMLTAFLCSSSFNPKALGIPTV